MKLLELRDEYKLRREFGFFDDFEWLVTAHRWTTLAVDGGSTAIAQSDAAGGIVTGATGATDNNEIALRTTNEIFLFANEKPLLYESRLKYTEAATDDANIAVGFADAFGANLLVDDGAGPKTTMSGALIYKVDGGTVWKFVTSLGTAQTISTSQHTAGGAYQVLTIEIRQASAGASGLEAVPYLDGLQMLDANFKPIKHNLGYTSATEMNAGIYVKAGGATTETPLCDYIAAYQLR